MNRRLFLTAAVALGAAACDRTSSRAQSPEGATPPTGGTAASDAGATAAAQNDPLAVAAREWLANNARQPGVVSLPTGVQYRVLRAGPADGAHPGRDDEVKVHYEGSLTNGQVFDSSLQRGAPAIMGLADLIPAWQQVVPLMRPRDDWMVYVPPEQGYGAEGRPPRIPPHSVLVFRLILLDFLPATGNA